MQSFQERSQIGASEVSTGARRSEVQVPLRCPDHLTAVRPSLSLSFSALGKTRHFPMIEFRNSNQIWSIRGLSLVPDSAFYGFRRPTGIPLVISQRSSGEMSSNTRERYDRKQSSRVCSRGFGTFYGDRLSGTFGLNCGAAAAIRAQEIPLSLSLLANQRQQRLLSFFVPQTPPTPYLDSDVTAAFKRFPIYTYSSQGPRSRYLK